MKNKLFLVTLLLFLFPLGFSEALPGANTGESPQSTKKPREDYMSSFLLRNAKPLGLKDDAPLRKFLSQPSIKWAMRSGGRHILN